MSEVELVSTCWDDDDSSRDGKGESAENLMKGNSAGSRHRYHHYQELRSCFPDITSFTFPLYLAEIFLLHFSFLRRYIRSFDLPTERHHAVAGGSATSGRPSRQRSGRHQCYRSRTKPPVSTEILRSGHADASWHNSSPMLPTPTQPRRILPPAPLPAQHSLHPSTRRHGAQAPAIGPRLTREHVLS